VDGIASRNFGIYENGNWQNTGSDLNGDVRDLVVFNNYIYAGGMFSSPVQGIGKWSEPAGIDESKELQTLVIRPNPADDHIVVDLSGFSENEILEATIIGNDGKTLARYEDLRNGEASIDISHLTAGVYVVKVCNERGEFTSGRLMVYR
jgi:hypothetical protein